MELHVPSNNGSNRGPNRSQRAADRILSLVTNNIGYYGYLYTLCIPLPLYTLYAIIYSAMLWTDGPGRQGRMVTITDSVNITRTLPKILLMLPLTIALPIRNIYYSHSIGGQGRW